MESSLSSSINATNQRGQSRNIAELQNEFSHSQQKNMIQGQNGMDYSRSFSTPGNNLSPPTPISSFTRNSTMSPTHQASLQPSRSWTKSPVSSKIPDPPLFRVPSTSLQSKTMHSMPSSPSEYNKTNLREVNKSPTPAALQNQIQLMKNKDESKLSRQNSRESVSHSSSFANGRETPSFR